MFPRTCRVRGQFQGLQTVSSRTPPLVDSVVQERSTKCSLNWMISTIVLRRRRMLISQRCDGQATGLCDKKNYIIEDRPFIKYEIYKMLIKIYLNILFKWDIITLLLHQNSIKLNKLYSTLLKFVYNFSFTNYSNSCKKKYFRKYDVINDDVITFLLSFAQSVKNLISFYL